VIFSSVILGRNGPIEVPSDTRSVVQVKVSGVNVNEDLTKFKKK
jgi:hypothetical protein